MEDLLNMLVKKIDEAKLKHNIVVKDDITHKPFYFEVPKEREFEKLYIASLNQNLPLLLESNFQDYKFIKGYEAIWSSKHKKIEFEINCFIGIMDMLQEIIDIDYKEVKENSCCDSMQAKELFLGYRKIKVASNKDINIFVGKASKEFECLSGLKLLGSIKMNMKDKMTVHIENIDVETHKDAEGLLKKMGYSLLFQLNALLEIPITMQYERVNMLTTIDDVHLAYLKVKESTKVKLLDIKYEYDNESMVLYLDGKNFNQSPLNQFLSYYQCLEFYFPIYSNLYIKDRVQKLLKDPLFDPTIDSNITKILSIIRSNKNSEVWDERKQLETVIRSCLDQDHIKEFVSSNREIKEFYEKGSWKKISNKCINFNSKNIDIIHEVSERIYDIRCRIVHKKSSEDREVLILPYSQEIRFLRCDIKIIEYLARKVLIDNSRRVIL